MNLVNKKSALNISDYTSTNMAKQDVINLLEHSYYVEEIFYQLTHEINKITFLLKTVRKIFNYQHSHSLIDIFLMFGCNILMIAKLKVKSIIEKLLYEKQLLNISRLKEFLMSKYHTQIINRLYKTRNSCEKMEKEIKNCFRFMHYIKKNRIHQAFYMKELSPSFISKLAKKFQSYHYLNYSNINCIKIEK
jgi:hypothetical protein